MEKPGDGLEKLLAIMARLRDPHDGCPWDLEQDFSTILPHTLEEAYEVADAIERQDMNALREELGDLLFQIVFYAQMAKEAGLFDFNAILSGITDKMIERHPHVFAQAKIEDAAAQTQAWEEGKEQKRRLQAAAQGKRPSQMDGIALGLPALLRADKLQKRAAKIGFDWPTKEPVFQKVREELEEVQKATSPTHQQEEIGDLLFAVANLARHFGVNPEEALRQANKKFETRFRRVEEIVSRAEVQQPRFDLASLDAAWEQVKAEEK